MLGGRVMMYWGLGFDRWGISCEVVELSKSNSCAGVLVVLALGGSC
jgi:hypothetical protein